MAVLSRPTLAILVHDGESVLPQTLASLSNQLGLNGVTILVICNGCADSSYEVAVKAAKLFEGTGAAYEVICLGRVGRLGAIALAQRRTNDGLLIVDQDAKLSSSSIVAVERAFNLGYNYVTLRPRVGSSLSFLVNAYYRFWCKLNYVRKSPSSCGFYAISPKGLRLVRAMQIESPDDKFIRLHFPIAERTRIETETYEISPCRDLPTLVRSRARYNSSNRAIKRRAPSLVLNDVPRRIRDEFDVIWASVGEAAVFGLVLGASRIYECFDLMKRYCRRQTVETRA